MIELKRDPYVLAFAGLFVCCITALVWHHDVTFAEAARLVGTALVVPAVWGRKGPPLPPPPDGVG